MTGCAAKDILTDAIGGLIHGDYVLLDCPYYGNVGDVLIWQATVDVLKSVRHRCLYATDINNYHRPRIGRDTAIVFMGGGNFGDLWPRHQQFRHRVMAEFPDNPIVQLPQSVYFESEENLRQDIDAFARHRGEVTICLREEQSFDFVRKHYPMVKALLLPDMVLGIDIERWLRRNHISPEWGEGTLYFHRRDKERVERECPVPFDAEGDWPTLSGYRVMWQRRCDRVVETMQHRHCSEAMQRRATDWMQRRWVKDAVIRNGVRYLMPYRRVCSDRLHAAVLAALLGKEVLMLDNSYGKCAAVYRAWMGDWENVRLVKE